ncbi:uncharacterized protein CANTADRAFT_97027 [Suhomyces tanzawaensis NRRL Y-17324]|uniref:Multicopper oxidase n=1 Tax=Suhomyces tanzawaensis NRRL Y-17324 TaxID=984487 RepID=A0A1E4SCX1_9ASCO|nr:uncharacterized protein CANTADRAFT_97027 [Suhomyces tanzawaensis NRRL Y-17324]ODV77364.1 hypothetical protein CANTADRAFT_97027 [Suhomyces tanzawaensis NRRL Y-17324]
MKLILYFLAVIHGYILPDLPKTLPPLGSTAREYTFNITRSYANPAGFYRSGFLINGQSPGPAIEGDEDEWITVTVNNFTPFAFTIHFHGILQKGTPWFDGVPGLSQYPILSGDTYTYHFQLKEQYGSAWYHSHYRGYSSDGILGPIYIRPSQLRARPYKLISDNDEDIQEIIKMERTPTNIIVDDYFKMPMDDTLLKMDQYGIDPLCIQSILVNGKGRVYCHSELELRNSTEKIIDTMGCFRDLFSNGYADLRNHMDNYALENPGFSSHCSPTFSDIFNLQIKGKKWHYINIINAGAQYTKSFSIDDHEFHVIAIDGVFVIPEKVHQIQISSGSRVTIVLETDRQMHNDTNRPFLMRFAAIRCPQYIEGLALLSYGETHYTDVYAQNGFRVQNLQGEINGGFKGIDIPSLRPFEEKTVKTGKADHTFNLFLNRSGVVEFTMFKDGAKLPASSELLQPLYFQEPEVSKYVLDSHIKHGEVVDIIMNNFRRYNHPIHLHGHTFRLISYNNKKSFKYNTMEDALLDGFSIDSRSPCFDSILVPPNGHAVIRFEANNPGIWLLHCHNLGHLIGGMGAVIYESLHDIPEIPQYLHDQAHVHNSLNTFVSGILGTNHDTSYLLLN